MAAPLATPSGAFPISSGWHPVSSLRFLLRLFGIGREQAAGVSAARAPVRPGLGEFDWDGDDTSLTQAELEVLK